MSFISIGGAGTPLTGDRQAYGQPFQLRALHRPGLAIAGFWLASSGAVQMSWAGSKEPVRQALARVPLPSELEGAVAKRCDEYRAGRLCAVYALGLLGIDSGVPGRGLTVFRGGPLACLAASLTAAIWRYPPWHPLMYMQGWALTWSNVWTLMRPIAWQRWSRVVLNSCSFLGGYRGLWR